MKKVSLILLSIFISFTYMIYAKADDSKLNTGSSGTWDPSYATGTFTSGLTEGQNGLRLTVVNEEGVAISRTVDYWENWFPNGALMLSGSSYKTNIVNNRTLSYEMVGYHAADGNPSNIDGAGKGTWEM